MQAVQFKYGIVSEWKPGYAKVVFAEDDNLVTDWWAIVSPTSLKDKSSSPLNVNEHVVCLCDERMEEGVVLGAIHNETDTPVASADANTFIKKFEDGTVLKYNKSSHELTADVKGKVTVTAEDDINATSDANIKAKATVKATIEAPAIELKGNVTVLGTLAAGTISATGSHGDGKITSAANIETTGDVKAANVEATTEVKAGLIPLSSHKHTGVQTGGSTTGTPTP